MVASAPALRCRVAKRKASGETEIYGDDQRSRHLLAVRAADVVHKPRDPIEQLETLSKLGTLSATFGARAVGLFVSTFQWVCVRPHPGTSPLV